MHRSRVIRLRRPPTLSVQEGLFVPERPDRSANSLLDEIELHWQRLCRSNPKYFDGRLCHVLGVHRNGHGGAVLHIIECAYRFFAVQHALGDSGDMGVRPLGVKGVIERDGKLLMGLRSPKVAMYADMWEFAPSGSVDFGRQPHEVIANELEEETGVQCSGEPTAIAILFDPILRCWEIVYRLRIVSDAQPRLTDEYPELAWHDLDRLPQPMSPIAQQIAGMLLQNRTMDVEDAGDAQSSD